MKIGKTVYILLDYYNRFYAEWDKNEFNMKKFTKYLEDKGFKTICVKFCDIDFRSMKFRGSIVLYSSSEVRHYKEYIEDILLGVYHEGGILIPDFYLFRSHHNKSFQEIYKVLLNLDNLNGKSFGAINEFMDNKNSIKFPVVLKASDSAGSKGVFLAKDVQEAIGKAKRLSNSFDCSVKRWYFQSKAILAVKLKNRDKERIYRNNTKKFIIQELILDLNDDWKVLIFGKRYYVLNRKVRNGDFRASGSGKFSYVAPPDNVLDFSETIYERLNSPYASLDIAFDGNNCYLIEFQALYFGLYTILHADFYYEKDNNVWRKKPKTLSIEEEFADCINDFIKANYCLGNKS